MVRNQDIELNLRLKKSGGKILLCPDIVSYYHARGTFKSLAVNNFKNGFWVIYGSRFAGLSFSARHLVPFFFLFSLSSSLILSLLFHPFIYLFLLTFMFYTIMNVSFSFSIALKKGFTFFPLLLLSFSVLHLSYGVGSFFGFFKFFKEAEQCSYRNRLN